MLAPGEGFLGGFFGCGVWQNGLWDLEINPTEHKRAMMSNEDAVTGCDGVKASNAEYGRCD